MQRSIICIENLILKALSYLTKDTDVSLLTMKAFLWIKIAGENNTFSFARRTKPQKTI